MLLNKAAISSGVRLRFVLFKSTTGDFAGSVITSSAGFDSGSVAPAFALAKSAAISSALSWRFGSLFVVSATASSATGLGSTTGSGSGAL